MRFLVLGPVAVRLDEREIEIGGGKQRALLALLLVHAGEVVASERLVEDLWAGQPPASAAKLVQGYVSQLRRALGPDAIVTRGPSYLLRVDESDAAEFERMLRDVQHQTWPAQQAVRLLRDALGLWRGPAFADVAYEPWAQAEIGRLEELRLLAFEELQANRLDLGEAAQLVPELEAKVSEHPLRERLWSYLMLALYRSGRQAEALEAYAQARRALVDDLGIEPTPNLRALHQSILRQDPALEVVETAVRVTAVGGSFVGRERELSELRSGLDDAFGGHGRLFLVQGEPGIGKSRLADELIALARARGARVPVGRCWEAGGAPAFWPWRQSLRTLIREMEPAELREQLGGDAADLAQLLPDLRRHVGDLAEPPPLESDGGRFRLFEAVCSFLGNAAQARPVVLFLDDLHAADESSLMLLRFLAREFTESRVLVVAAYRDADPTMREPLVGALAELVREPQTHRIALSGLAKAEVGRYIELLSGETRLDVEVASINEETEGNPFFVGEIVRLLMTEAELRGDDGSPLVIPQSVREVIARRVRHLSEACNEMLVMASVLGREFAIDELAQLAGRSRDWLLGSLDEALNEKVVSDAPGRIGRLRFDHVLIRDTVYGGLSTARCASLHRQAGEAIEEVYARDLNPHLAELAHHFIAALPAGTSEKALEYARRAGDQAAHVFAFEEALRLYDTALRLVRDEGLRASILESLAQVAQLLGRLQEASAALEDALELHREHGDSVAAGRVLTALSNVFWRHGDPRKDVVLAEALTLLEAEPPGPELVTALVELAGHRALDAVNSEAIVAAERALELSAQLELPEPARALGYRGTARASLGEQEGLEDMRRALALAVQQRQWRAAAVLHNNLAQAFWLYEGPRTALAACQEGIDFCKRNGIDEWATYTTSTSLPLLVWCGRLEEALTEAGLLGEQAQATNDRPILIQTRSLQLRLGAQRGGGEDLLAAAEQLVNHARDNGEPHLMAPGLAGPAQLFQACGRPHDAQALLEELEQVPGIRDDPTFMSLLPEIVRCALAVSAHELAHRLVNGTEPRAPLFEHTLRTTQALLTEASGDHASAADLYGDAARRWHEFENAPERAYALLGYGRCLLALKRPIAGATLREARDQFASIGYKLALTETDTLIAETSSGLA